MEPIRVDIIEGTWKEFWKNVFWGTPINNMYLTVELTCGSCGGISIVETREKNKELKCPCCGVENLIDLYTHGW